uniref:Uncharacterized protein n=1 Tax=Glossina brevipalpis TaxID=37001 RepID=A0A1A9W9P3_9MUSC
MSRDVARELSLHKCDIIETCKRNRNICETNGRHDLLLIWTLAEATPNIPSETKYEMFFYNNPFKKFLLETLIMHFATLGDLQTAVTIACVLHKCPPPKDLEGFAVRMLFYLSSIFAVVILVTKKISSLLTSPSQILSLIALPISASFS